MRGKELTCICLNRALVLKRLKLWPSVLARMIAYSSACPFQSVFVSNLHLEINVLYRTYFKVFQHGEGSTWLSMEKKDKNSYYTGQPVCTSLGKLIKEIIPGSVQIHRRMFMCARTVSGMGFLQSHSLYKFNICNTRDTECPLCSIVFIPV